MGNTSSRSAKPSLTKKKKKNKKPPSLFCCPCTLSKSSSTLSITETCQPTFDRLSSNEKPPLPIYNAKSTPAQLSPTEAVLHREDLEKTVTSVNNRRSVSLHNVILTVPDSDSKPLQCKPPLPPGKSITTSKLPTATRRSFRGNLINTKRTYYSQSIEHARLSIEDLEKSLHGASSIDQWIDSLPILGTPSLNRNKNHLHLRSAVSTHANKKIKRSYTLGDDYEQNLLNGSYRQENESPMPIEPQTSNDHVLSLKCNREYANLAKEMHLHCYLNDFLLRMKLSQVKQTFKDHFSLSTIIYPFAGIDQTLADDLSLCLLTPAESLLPTFSSNLHSNYKLHEQLRSKCYFIPLTTCKIEIDDEEYQRQSKEVDRTHVVITLETKSKDPRGEEPSSQMKKATIDLEAAFLFVSNDSFQTGSIRINPEKLGKQWQPFLSYSIEKSSTFLSSTLTQHWFQTLMLVNQTCAVAKRFLKGDGSHITYLLKQQSNHRTNSSPVENHLTFAALRLPPFMYATDTSNLSPTEAEDRSTTIDAFSSMFLSDNKHTSNDTIHIDYEQYSFALMLHRWPKSLLEHYHTHSTRSSARRWPSNYHMNILVKKPLLLIPIGVDHQWEIHFDCLEQSLFELMNGSSLCFYALCQQIFSRTAPTRTVIKHCFLNYCEKYGLPFSNHRESTNDQLVDLLGHFLSELHSQLTNRFIPNYFNHRINLYSSVEDYNQWFDYIDQCVRDRISFSFASFDTISNRPLIVEFLFHFIDQLYQTFHIKRSQFHLSESVLLDLHQQLCERFSNDTNNNSTSLQKCINDLLNNRKILEHIQTTLTYDFETNAELVHTCLNQVRKADSSLIFHYTWTIYIQYLHTYYNVLWNV